MRTLLRSVLMVSVLCLGQGCPVPQPGCTAENCRAMVDSCRVEFSEVPSALCSNVAPRPAGFDSSKYCVDVCNAKQGRGKLVQCIAEVAPQCDAARDAGQPVYLVVDTACANPDGGTVSLSDAGLACGDKCFTVRRACDDKCAGGSACDTCRRTGRPDCSAECPATGYPACMDCSASCGLAASACVDRCPP